ncbi:wax ester/triacylglycerol synthase family O-acyltransferase [Nocardia sp. NPDC055321]
MEIDESFWMWLESPETPMHVAALAIFAPETEPAATVAKRIVTEFRRHTPTDERFRSRLVGGLFPRPGQHRVVDDIDIDFHLRHKALPTPGGELELAQLISRLHSIALDPYRPRWEMHVIEGLHGNRFAIYIKVHHALINGVEAIKLLERGLSNDRRDPIPPPPWAKGNVPKSADAHQERPTQRAHVTISGITNTLSALSALPTESSGLIAPWAAPHSMINVDISPQRRVCTASIEFARVAAIAQGTGTSVNDVVLSACGAALRRYLSEAGDLPDKALIAGVPVSIAHDRGAGSSVGIMLATLGTDIDDPIERLHRIARSVGAGKARQAALPAQVRLLDAVLAMTPHTLRQLIPGALNVLAPMFNVIISNVPGPREQLYLDGAPLVELYPLSLLFRGEALNITAVSLAGRLNFGLTACNDALPHVQRLAHYLEHGFDELDSALGAHETGLLR